jgi:hypothetical protein
MLVTWSGWSVLLLHLVFVDLRMMFNHVLGGKFLKRLGLEHLVCHSNYSQLTQIDSIKVKFFLERM